MGSKLVQTINQGISEFKKQRFQRARDLFLKSIALSLTDDQKAISFYNLGLCYYAQREYLHASKHFLKSTELGFLKANWELCLSRLHLGDLEALNLFGWRPDKRIPNFGRSPLPEIKNLSDLARFKKPLVLNEQGFGDEFLFSRGVSLLQGKDFSYQVYPESLEVFQQLWQGHFFSGRELDWDFIYSHDSWIFSGDLFALYTLTKGTLPSSPHSLSLNPTSSKFGICFQTNRISPNSDQRSIPLDIFRSIIENQGLITVSLQKDMPLDFSECPDLNDFRETLDIMQNLKAVITVDTAVAHLSALSGVRTYLIYPQYLDWRWKFDFYGSHVTVLSLEEFRDLKIS